MYYTIPVLRRIGRTYEQIKRLRIQWPQKNFALEGRALCGPEKERTMYVRT